MQRISPFLWFNDNAEEAANFYVSVFKNSRITKVVRDVEGGQRPTGSVMVVAFTLDGQEFMALNGGPIYKLSPAISFVVNCDTQAEIDYYWDKLCDGGQPVQCGWLTDRFGLSWQVTPTIIGKLLSGDAPERASRVMTALEQMIKLDISALQKAYDGR